MRVSILLIGLVSAVTLGVVAAVSLPRSSQAQSNWNCCTTTTGITSGTGTIVMGGYDYIPTDCDSNQKTPTEAIACKLDYWKKRVEEIQAEKAAIEKRLAAAQERVSAFTDAQRGK